MCHPEMQKIAAVNSIPHNDVAVPFLKVPNCIDVFLSPEKKHELDAGMNVHYMSAGWIKFWKDIFVGGPGWDPVTARMMLGVNDKIVILDTGCVTLSEEDIFEIFDYIQLPIEVEKITLDYFKNMIFELCVKALNP
ncbi:hypothetical protein AGMMS50212_15250 [Spirochaetia bacterium]|nr:hypothetical protein AGMMS50212_15250 [Spirochaetia bacterium]